MCFDLNHIIIVLALCLWLLSCWTINLHPVSCCWQEVFFQDYPKFCSAVLHIQSDQMKKSHPPKLTGKTRTALITEAGKRPSVILLSFTSGLPHTTDLFVKVTKINVFLTERHKISGLTGYHKPVGQQP